MFFSDQTLPFSIDYLEPVLSTRQIEFHFGKHQLNYATKLTDLVKNQSFSGMKLEDIIKQTAFDDDKIAIYNNAAQLWNHIFYWECLKAPTDNNEVPMGELSNAITNVFGSENFMKKSFIESGISIFGSGWVWLVINPENKRLEIIGTHNADNPLIQNKIPLLTVDVWEHAYYLDYQNRRLDYLKNIVEKAVNWSIVQERYVAYMNK